MRKAKTVEGGAAIWISRRTTRVQSSASSVQDHGMAVSTTHSRHAHNLGRSRARNFRVADDRPAYSCMISPCDSPRARLAGRRGQHRTRRRQLPDDAGRAAHRRWLAARRRRADPGGAASDHRPAYLAVAGGHRRGDRGPGLRPAACARAARRRRPRLARRGSARCRRTSVGAGDRTARCSAGLRCGRSPRLNPRCCVRRRALLRRRSARLPRVRRWRRCSRPISAGAVRRRCWPAGCGARLARPSGRFCSMPICAALPSCPRRRRRRRWSPRSTPGSTALPGPFTPSTAKC